VPGVVAVGGYTALADLQQKLSVLGEFQDLPVAVAVTGQPDIVIGVDRNAVLAATGPSIAIQAPLGRAGRTLRERRMKPAAIEPLVRAAFCRAAPSLDVAARRAELEDGRGRPVSILPGVA